MDEQQPCCMLSDSENDLLTSEINVYSLMWSFHFTLKLFWKTSAHSVFASGRTKDALASEG